ncbi:basic helix-loop-helix transcription factor scleraxis isoform X1 [Phlebotomus papatasi]|uniref:basic helix-loop-helix transcription factor scleraxis isoform X1 n=1 Tax=Phlebotomus papatasi TaxID=29031 RepID=UPI00248380BA|nr:basic helix-loop-helix transcription factor scleraxis isoform X1 [Phlebotomus papatasi]
MDYDFVVGEFYGVLDEATLGSACQSLPAKQRYQANARERYRTHSVNSAFNTLRLLIPTEPKNRKLSKIETLRLAKSYISHLAAILLTGNYNQPCVYVTTPSSFHPSCLDFHREDDEDDEEKLMEHSRTSICTFCVAMKNNTS